MYIIDMYIYTHIYVHIYIYMYTCIPNPGIDPRSPTLQADSLPAEPQGKPCIFILHIK